MKRIPSLLLPALALLVAPVALTAAGSSAPPKADPADEAVAAYERGLEHRDNAWKITEEWESTSDERERAKLERKIEKEYEKAIRAYRSAIESNPEMHQAFSSLGYALRKTGRFDESLEAYDRALELEPGYPEAIEYRAEAYLGLNRLQEAKEAYMQLFRDDRERADELMAAMENWLEDRRADARGVDAATIESFASWVEERQKVSGNTARLDSGSERDW